jgi:hypothetical protein
MALALCESCGGQHELEALPEFEDELELEGLGELEDELEFEGEDEFEDEYELEGEQEFEDELEFEDEGELESELSPIRKIYPDAMMEHLGELAAEAETEQEAAEHFLPLIGMAASKLLPVAAKALAPMAKKALPQIAKTVTRVTPHLTRGVGKIARKIHRQPGARPLLRAVPSIARRTVHSIARQVAHGRRVTPRSAVRTLARQTQRVLGNPRHRAHALRHHQRMERHLHRGVGRGMIRPHWRYRWIRGRRVRVPYAPGPARVAGTAARGVPSQAATPSRAAAASGALATPGRVTRTGRIVAGQCVCPACPVCGGAVKPAAAPAPSYCRCCGQLLR